MIIHVITLTLHWGIPPHRIVELLIHWGGRPIHRLG